MEDKLFCVLAIHNEEKYLPYSLQSVSDLGCKVVVVLDRCSDSSEVIVEKCLPSAVVVCKQEPKWDYSIAEAKSVGCEIARQNGAEAVLVSDADVILDAEAVKKALSLVSSSFVVLAYNQYSLYGSAFSRVIDELHNLFCVATRKFGIHPVRAGVFVGLAKFMFFEDKDGEYDFLQQKHETVWIKTDTIHLRPRWDIKSQFKRGIVRARLPQYNLFKVALTSFLLLQPLTIVGYLKEKLR